MLREKITLNRDLIEIVNHLNENQAGTLFKHILHYANGGSDELKDKLLRIAFVQIRLDMLEDNSNLKQTYVYCVKLISDSDMFLKIGISYDCQKRFKQFNSNGFLVEEVFIEKYGNRKSAEYREYCLHEKYKHAKHKPNILFPGHTECFEVGCLSELLGEEVKNV